jgi:hypothetical protein
MLKSFWFWFMIMLIGIQFIPLNIPQNIDEKRQNEIEAPPEVMSILKRSCYDCHSNHVEYPWYDKIAPASWYVQSHIEKGRKILNFSEWKAYDQNKQLKVMNKLPKAIVIRMPLTSYLWLHEEATLSAEDKKIITEWVKKSKEEIK